ncbi:MAG: YigZ family protein [Chloroflexaceae bacterium]|nr:YigZ family protein [Chloroflexaceae bacterium]
MNPVLPDRYPIPAAAARAEIRVVNSRFIGIADYTPSADAAKALIARVRAEYPDATHHVYAYLVGYGASVTAGMSDDGEPSGTAGRPVLAVLRGSNLGDVTVVVTRYFGGTLLGTGGLVRAYSDVTRAVLEILPRTERVEQCTMLVEIDYAAYTAVRQLLDTLDAEVTSEDFATRVTLEVTLPVIHRETCAARLAELTAGQAEMVTEAG